MMTGRLYIDGNDAYTSWGVYVVSGGWNEVIAYPPLKAVESNDWFEEDGIEADLSAPMLNTKEVTINFAYDGSYRHLIEFVTMLSNGAYHTFNCVHIHRHYKLRMTQTPKLEQATALGFISVKFANDYPLYGYTYAEPSSSIPMVRDYVIDDRPFTDYGCRILQGSLSEVLKTPAVKQGLTRNISTRPGAIYDDGQVTFKSKDVKINCHMRADSLDSLWRNYDALLYDLIRPGERMLEINALKQVFPVHYKSATVSAFYPDDVWLDFALSLTFIRDFRLDDDDLVLATDDGAIITTDNGFNAIAIYLK